MTRVEIAKLVEDIGYPYAYESFGEGQTNTPPYLIYAYPQNAPLYADNGNYCEIDRLQINLYTRTKDLDAEKKVEQALIDHELDGFRRRENYYPSENIFEIIYELEVIIDG